MLVCVFLSFCRTLLCISKIHHRIVFSDCEIRSVDLNEVDLNEFRLIHSFGLESRLLNLILFIQFFLCIFFLFPHFTAKWFYCNFWTMFIQSVELFRGANK